MSKPHDDSQPITDLDCGVQEQAPGLHNRDFLNFLKSQIQFVAAASTAAATLFCEYPCMTSLTQPVNKNATKCFFTP